MSSSHGCLHAVLSLRVQGSCIEHNTPRLSTCNGNESSALSLGSLHAIFCSRARAEQCGPLHGPVGVRVHMQSWMDEFCGIATERIALILNCQPKPPVHNQLAGRGSQSGMLIPYNDE